MKEKQTVYWLSGLPASGKSFWAKELVSNSNGRIKRVNKDDVRAMLDVSIWSKEREKFVLKIQNGIIMDSLMNGYSVVCDNTNFHAKHLEDIKAMIAIVEDANKTKIELVEKFFDTPLLDCVARDAKRGDASVGSEVIYRMWNQYLRPKNPSNPTGAKAFIYDIDGTLAKMNGRGPFEHDKVDTDTLIQETFVLYRALADAGYKAIIFTGRDGCSEVKTKKWLEDNNIYYDHFDMRTTGDSRSDRIIKKELFDKIKNKYNVVGVIDDRNTVCGMWREIGLMCYQCDFGFF